MGTPADTTQQLATLRTQYIQQLPGKLAELQRALDAARHDPARPQLEALHRQLHALNGSGASYGFPHLSDTARLFEHHVLACLSQPDTVTPEALAEWDRLLSAVVDSAGDAPQAMSAPPSFAAEPAPAEQEIQRVYVLDADRASGEFLAVQLRYFGYEAYAFQSVALFTDALRHKRPDAVILDVNLPAGLDALHALPASPAADIPITFVSAQDDLPARLKSVRAGGTGYFLKPVNVDLLVDHLDHLTQHTTAEPFRILIVEDAEMLAQLYATTLEAAGMITRTVSQPMHMLDAIQDFNPELILMDMYMPEARGDELARVIRQDPAYVSIPIVFLSAEVDVDRQFAAMQTGGDEFLTKPIDLARLVFAVSNRVGRYRVLRTFMQHDSLTGLLNHTKSKEFLQSEVARAQREHYALSFAMIDIDHFKQVNDKYGHPVGDRVIKGLARLLQQRLRRSDLIGRYGGEEFAVVLPNTTRDTAHRVLDELREMFSNIAFIASNARFACTFSCGVVEAQGNESATELIRRADDALYAAKRGGRNRVVMGNAVRN